ncbi:MAG TPA: pitrilysin family protein [Burkholderiales bacterium]
MLLRCIHLLLCLVLAAPLAVLAAGDPAAETGPRDVSAAADDLALDAPLPIDDSIAYRSLPNGMRYWVRPGVPPEGKITLWLRVGTGSLNETEEQRGLAHLLEHLAFNGSANFPPGTLIKRFEAAGLTFGAHQNATTSFLDTVYKLTIPNDPALLDLSLLYFADVAYRLTLDPEEVARERAVVQAERRARNNAATRAFNRLLAALAPGSRFIERMPIGDERVVANATAEQLRAYYEKWYRPDNTTLLVAGDVDPAMLDALVRKHFGDWKAAGPAPANHAPGIRPYTADRAEVITEWGLVASEVNIAYLEPPRDFATVRGYRQWLVQSLAGALVNARLHDRVLRGEAPFTTAWTNAETMYGKTLVEARAKGGPRQWEPVLRELVAELKRARDYGFSEDEFRHAREVLLARLERDALERADAGAEHWLDLMDAALDRNGRPVSAAQAHVLGERLLATITRAEVEAAFRARFAPARRTIAVTLPRGGDGRPPTADEVLAIVRAVESQPVARHVEKAWPRQLLAVDPKPGSTVGHTLNGELGVLSVSFANGVRLHVRPMRYKKEHVSVRITLAGGRINETPENVGITEAAALPFETPATDRLSSIDIRRIMKTRQVRVHGRDTPSALELNIEGRLRDLEDGFRLAHLLLTRARIEPAAFERWRRQAMVREVNTEGSVSARLNRRVDALLTNNDPRFRALSPADVRRITLADAQAWLDGMLASAPIEVAIVGDIGHEQALALAAKYLGSLPPRPEVAGANAHIRAISAAPGPYVELVKVDTATPKAMVYLGWRGPDWEDVRDWQVLDLAGRVLTSRLLEEVRARRGLAYSIRAHSFANTAYRGNGRFRVSFVVDPQQAEAAADIVQRVTEEFVRTGPTEQELAIAREQAALDFRGAAGTPGFWLDLLGDLDYMGGDLAWVKDYPERIARYTCEDVLEVLRKYLTPERFVRVISMPAELSPNGDGSRQSVATID